MVKTFQTVQIFCCAYFLGIVLIASCGKNAGNTFMLLPPENSGVSFSNSISTDSAFNALEFEYIYNGGGVGIADLNGDTLPDLFFTGNQVSCKLYLNQGAGQFLDVTSVAGTSTDRWCTGVALADVNDDGRKDIYISVAGFKVDSNEMANLLFINQGNNADGIPTFTEEARQYGLDDKGYSTQAAFLDYDLDGDLDMYLLTNGLEKTIRNNLRPKRIQGEAPTTDRLYRKNADGSYTNVSSEAGIRIEGYGLGVVVCDINLDGYPDIYTANDFLSNDLMWVNNQDGTFTNKASTYFKHQTHNGMGVDIADFNNDKRPDITVLDMLPEDNYRQKMMIPYVNRDRFKMNKNFDYQDQYMRNTLQYNQGFDEEQNPMFSEIGNLAGIDATDWSWAVLMTDFDSDGWKDIFITNGYRKDVTNLDYINYSNYNQLFGTVEEKASKAVEDLDNAKDVPLKNYMFHNQGSQQFVNVAEAWGLGQESFSNGAAYGDLDLDGDLDLVVNNIDQPAFVYLNQIRKPEKNQGNFLRIKLDKGSKKIALLNAKVWLYHNGKVQYQDYTPYRGYKSTMEDIIHFGVDSATLVDSLVIQWLDGSVSRRYQVKTNQVITIAPGNQMGNNPRADSDLPYLNITQADSSLGIAFQHQDHHFDDLKTVRTLPHQHSVNGPPIATGDINGDGREDFYIGGNVNQSGVLFIQLESGRFIKQQLGDSEACQDADAVFFDLEGDGDQDLYVVSGGSHLPEGDPGYQDRLYLNDGNGQFGLANELIPTMNGSGACVTACDYDLDGDTDLFVGNRLIPLSYPLSPRSHLLENRNGELVDNTPESLQSPGMITDAIWQDLNSDQSPELVIVGEWMPVNIFQYEDGSFKQSKMSVLDSEGQSIRSEGMWFHVNTADIDRDGDMDLLLGNLGTNSSLCATQDQPLQVYAKDFDENGIIDPLITCYIQDEQYLLHERDLLINQIPGIKKRFPNYNSYAESDFRDIFTEKELAGTVVLNAYTLSSAILINDGNLEFTFRELPFQGQLAPVMTSIIYDFNQDSYPDILTAGNFHNTETTQIGRFDASFGSLMLGKTDGTFDSFSGLSQGLELDRNLRTLSLVRMDENRKLLLVGNYASDLQPYIIAPQSEMISPEYN